MRSYERNSSADSKVSEEGGEQGAPCTKAETPLQPVVKAMVRQAVLLLSMEVHTAAEIQLQPMEDITSEPEGGLFEGDCDPKQNLPWIKLLSGFVVPWREEPTLKQVFWTCDIISDSH